MKQKKIFLFVPFVLILFSYLFYTSYKDVRDRSLDEFNSQQFALAKQASRGIESFFIYYQRELLFLSKLNYVSELNVQGKELLTEFYKNHSDQIEAITIVDEKGTIKYTFPLNQSAIGQDISSQVHVRTIMKSHQPTVSDVFTSVQGYRAIAYHIPIFSGNDYRGSIAILIPLDKLGKRFIENIKTGETGYGSMISEDGVTLYHPDKELAEKNVVDIYSGCPTVLEILEQSLKEKKGTAICELNKTASGKKVSIRTLAAFYRISLDNTFWTILILTPEKEVYSILTSFRNRLFILFGLIILVMVTYFYLSLKAGSILKEEKKRKALENIIRESEKRFRIMFELSPAGIILIDDKGIIIEVNASFCKTLGYSRKEVIGNNISLFSLPKNDGDIEKNIAKILSGKTIKHEVENLKKDGTTCSIALYETMILLPDGKPGILSVSDDITELKRSQEKMQTLSRALESIGECVSITDFNNKILFVNNAFCKTYGYNEAELIGRDIDIIRLDKTDGKLGKRILSQTISGGWSGELINIRKDGSQFPINLSTSCIFDEDGNTIALIGIAVDITESKKSQLELIAAKEKAEESDKLKSAFLANISHELRTPLNAIIGFSNLIIDNVQDEESIAYSKIILNSGTHLLSLVEDIFDTTMIETGQIKITYEKTDITSVLNEVKNIIMGEMLREHKNDVELILNIDPASDRKSIVTDSRKVKQVLINLLRNAMKFTDKGYIEYGFSEIIDSNNNFLQFYIKDTGIGIDKTHHDTIFKMFRQIDDNHTRKYGGMGLGLSIVKRIIEILGGKIWVESEPNAGSIFYFTIPVLSDQIIDDDNLMNKVEPQQKNFTGKTVLVTEDEPSNFDFLNIVLNRMNIRVLWAKNGIEAISLCESDPSIDLVLMDIKIPFINGYEATRRIKDIRPDLPVVVQTAYVMAADKEEAEKAGCNSYLSKPIKINDLYEILKKYL